MRLQILEAVKTGQTLAEMRERLDGMVVEGKPLQVGVDDRCVPWLNHVVEGKVDGPPSSNVAVVISAKHPSKDRWRRFTITFKGPWSYEVDAFPTPFNNAVSPLSPGIPPSASPRA